jgi:hypothetical protein
MDERLNRLAGIFLKVPGNPFDGAAYVFSIRQKFIHGGVSPLVQLCCPCMPSWHPSPGGFMELKLTNVRISSSYRFRRSDPILFAGCAVLTFAVKLQEQKKKPLLVSSFIFQADLFSGVIVKVCRAV